ncbi:MAG TPA: SDR family oxidoreductase [Verrucomicrobiota bacterium]|nr:SDR family oxidoreductase [Verrucomicrobiota bacterium]HNU52982.1 SDR family oxidoreductase [Verrucomicrobiota bacterium]
METDLKDKVVLVTGASGGIGACAARAFAAEGARLVLHSFRHGERTALLRRELSAVDALRVQADLTRETAVRALFARAKKAFGRVDILVANAGIWEDQHVPLDRMPLAQWRRTIEADLTSVFLCCREFLRLVRRQRSGNLVFVGSTAALFGEAGHADYAAAKAAVAYGLTRTLKNEIARLAPPAPDYCGGRVNCVCPGWTMVPRTAPRLQDPDLVERVTATMALPKLARPTDVAHAIVFLASDRLAGHVTGQTLAVAGGMEGRWLWLPGESDLALA